MKGFVHTCFDSGVFSAAFQIGFQIRFSRGTILKCFIRVYGF